MENTQDARHVGKQRFPGPLRGLPPVGMHGIRGISRLDYLGCLGTDTIGCCPIGLSSRLGTRCPANTLLASCGGAIPPLALQPTMLFVSHQVCGSPIRSFDRGPHHAEPSSSLFQAIPIHWVASEDLGNGPTGHMKSHEAQGVVDVVGTPSPMGPHQGGCHGKDCTALLQTSPSTAQWLLARGLGKADEGIAPGKRVGKPCREIRVEIIQSGLGIGSIGAQAILLGLGHRQTDRLVFFLRRMGYGGHGCLSQAQMFSVVEYPKPLAIRGGFQPAMSPSTESVITRNVREMAELFGADRTLTKPLQWSEVLQSIHAILGQAGEPHWQ